MIDPGHVLYEGLKALHNSYTGAVHDDGTGMLDTYGVFLAHRRLLERYEQETCCATVQPEVSAVCRHDIGSRAVSHNLAAISCADVIERYGDQSDRTEVTP